MAPTKPNPRSRSDVDEPRAPRASVVPHRGTAEAVADARGRAPGTIRTVVVRRGSDEEAREVDAAGLRAALATPDACAWIDMTAPSPRQVSEIAELLGLHPLVAEDIEERNQRAKVEQVGDVHHIVLFGLAYDGNVEEREIDFVLGHGFLLTVHDAELRLDDVPALRVGSDHALARGADYVLYAITDWIVDGYFPVLDKLADEIDELQDDVIRAPSPTTLERLFVLKRELITIRRATSPAREIFNQLTNRDIGVISPDHILYFRDVYDHLIRVTDELDNYRELVSGTLDAYLSTVNNNLSLIMKRLTGVTVILAGIGAIAGIFGMSEAGVALSGGEASGFWMIAALTVLLAVAAAIVLRRIDWI